MQTKGIQGNIPTSYATCSIGYEASHTLPLKLKAIADAGFNAIELAMPDILAYGELLNGQAPAVNDFDTLVELGKAIRSQVEAHGLEVLMLQPFSNFEGWPKGSQQRKDAFDRAKGWMRVMEAVGTDMLQVGSSDSNGISSSFEELADDLAELADLLAVKGFRIAYENWCWATHAPDWKDVWKTVQMANRPNLGLCLDTFQSAGGEWADPTTESGRMEGISSSALERKWAQSLAELSVTVPRDKIFLLQISDAYKMSPPLKGEVDKDGLRPRGQWSHDYRPLPYSGGYLPIREFLEAVLLTGFRGYLSVEVFDAKGQEKFADLADYARKAMDGLQGLVKASDTSFA